MALVSKSHDGSSQKQPQDAAADEACGQADPVSIQLDRLALSQEPPLPAQHPASAGGAADSQLAGHHTDVYSSVVASEPLAGQETGYVQDAATALQGTAAATDAPAGHETRVVQESASPSQAAAAVDSPVSQHEGVLQGAAGSTQSTAADSQAEQDPGTLHHTAGLPEDTAASSAEHPAAAPLHDMQQHQPGLQTQSSAVDTEKMEPCTSGIILADPANPEGAESNGPGSALHNSVRDLGLTEQNHKASLSTV